MSNRSAWGYFGVGLVIYTMCVLALDTLGWMHFNLISYLIVVVILTLGFVFVRRGQTPKE